MEVSIPGRRKAWRLADLMLSDRQNTGAAYRLLGKALRTMRHWPPSSITVDQLGSYPKAISRLQQEGKLSAYTKQGTYTYLNNIVEANHRALKQVIRPTRDFQTLKTAAATIKGFELMPVIRKGHRLTRKPYIKGRCAVLTDCSRYSQSQLGEETKRMNSGTQR